MRSTRLESPGSSPRIGTICSGSCACGSAAANRDPVAEVLHVIELMADSAGIDGANARSPCGERLEACGMAEPPAGGRRLHKRRFGGVAPTAGCAGRRGPSTSALACHAIGTRVALSSVTAISESPTATHASHSRAHVVRSCRSALVPYLRVPSVGVASAAFSRFAPRAPCARPMHGKTQHVRRGVRASVMKISQNERVRVRVDLA